MERPTAGERRRLIKEYKSLVDAVTRLLYRADPIGIGITVGSPDDEYGMEAAAIARAVAEANNIDDLQRLVHAVFVQFFGEESAGPESAYAAITREIWVTSLAVRKQ
jgi:hypothetical protein